MDRAPDVDDDRTTGWGHVPALDGVRGLAVIVVLLFHGGVSWAKGGFLGVDAFFVLSGLLITSLLLDEGRRTGAVDLAHFWARRARRLLPALLLVVAAAGLYGATLAPRGSLDGLRKDAIATLFYVANWRFIQAGANYFEATAAPSVLRHTWSLAIEEQFYLVWPLVLWAVARASRRRSQIIAATAVIAALGTLASAAAMWVLFHPGEEPSRAYFGTDSRVQVVLSGALLAAAIAAWRRRSTTLGAGASAALGTAAAVGLAGFLAATVAVEGDETLLFRGGFLAVSVGVAALLAHIVVVPRGWSAVVFGWQPLRAVGLLSYGLYLWHWPVFLTVTRERTDLEGPALLAAKLAVTAVLSVASYVLVEQPIRRGALPRMQAAVAATLAMGLTAAAVIAGTELPAPRTSQQELVARTASGFPSSTRPSRDPGEASRVLIVGDSVGKVLADRLHRRAARAGLAFTNKGVLGCGVVRGGPYRYFGKELTPPRQCDSWPTQWANHVSRYDPDVVFASLGRWEVMDRVHAGRWTRLGDPAFDRYLEGELEEAVRILTASDAVLVLATAPYYLRGERPDGGRWPEDDPVRVNHFNGLLRKVADRHPNQVALLDLNAQTSRNSQYTPVIDGVDLRFDGVHFSPEGSNWLAPWLFDALLQTSPPVRTDGGRTPPSTTTPRPTTAPPPTPTTARSATTTAPPRSPTTTPAVTEPPPSSTTTSPPTSTSFEPPTTTSTSTPLPTSIPGG